jgi:hypothetical protein
MSLVGTPQVVIGHAEAERVTIEVVERGLGEWATANVAVTCGVWSGVFQWQFYRGELRSFGQQLLELHRSLSGSANLDPLEPNLTLKMTGDGKGHIIVEGRAEPTFYSGTFLAFQFDLDQTELPPIAAALIAADPDFPSVINR